eukprot:CAMPEP_0197496500 /NCGR_PEP_ID=MMETSP1311-20131121/44989_1 /TAXON_ID=464262 /ORGANISM="Genus nov. species nov., Strain RCC856" /LENGTH=48 /DNA_ID= /DNA_START= /DNA_END= /DNA_ORIENTATION=
MAALMQKNLRLKANTARVGQVAAVRAPRHVASRRLQVCRSAATDEIVE